MINVVIAGDFSPMNRVEKIIEGGEYARLSLDDLDKENSLFILNFETTIPSEDCKRITKVGPHLKCTNKTVEYLKKIGVTAVTLANNHTTDYGEEGLFNTIQLLCRNGIKTVGAGKDIQEAERPLYLSCGEDNLAIINCCEHEFSYAEKEKAGTNPLNPIRQYYCIKEARAKADYVIVIIHGGHEFFNLPSPRMQETYRFFIDSGADAVINHHQHCYSGFEYWQGKPIYYGLGNFCFDWPGRQPSFYKGYCVKLNLGKTVTSQEIPYTQCVSEPIISFDEFDGFREDISELNSIIMDPEKLEKEVENYFQSLAKSCERVISPFSNKYTQELVMRGVLPTLIAKEKIKLWKAYLDCESHRDVMLHYLKDNI